MQSSLSSPGAPSAGKAALAVWARGGLMRAAQSRWLAYGLLSAIAVAIALHLGKDANWDQRSYHYFAGMSAIHDRLAQDFFPSNVQSYLVPYAHVPFYVLASSGLPDKLVVAVLALLQSAALWAVWELGGRIAGGIECKRGTTAAAGGFDAAGAWASATLALTCALFLTQLGGSHVDALLAVPVLWAYVLLVREYQTSRAWHVPTAAALLGVATALKATNGLYAVVAALVLAWLPWAGSSRALRRGLIFVVVGIVSALAVAAPWWLRVREAVPAKLWPATALEVASEGTRPVGVPHLRFVPSDLADALLRPLWMVSPEQGIYTEPAAPDARFLALFVLLGGVGVAAGTVRGWRALRGSRTLASSTADRGLHPAGIGTARAAPSRALIGLTATYIASWVIWLFLSGNGRYFMPMALMLSAIVVGWVYATGGAVRWRLYALGGLAIVQMAVVTMGAQLRFAPVPWGPRWYDVEPAPALRERPALFLSLDFQPAAYLAAFVHPESSFAAVSGAVPLDPDHPGWSRIEDLAVRHHGRAYLLFPTDGKDLAARQREVDRLTMRLGLRADLDRCQLIRHNSLSSTGPYSIDISEGRVIMSPNASAAAGAVTVYAACPALAAPELRQTFKAEVGRVDAVFESVAHRCPLLLTPRGGTTVGGDGLWWRFDNRTDTVISLVEGVAYMAQYRWNAPRRIGKVEDILEGRFLVDCILQRDPLIEIKWTDG